MKISFVPSLYYAVGRRKKIALVTLELIIGFFILLWIYTGLNKLLDFTNFKVQISRSPFIESMANWISFALPVGELALASLLLFKRTRLLGLYLSLFLMALFTGYVYIMLKYSYDLPCSCGGILEKLSWSDHLIFNALATSLAIIGILIQINHVNFRRQGKTMPEMS